MFRLHAVLFRSHRIRKPDGPKLHIQIRSCSQVVITEDDSESYKALDLCEARGGSDVQWSQLDRASEVHHGRKLVEALETAKHGTTIEIAADCCSPTTGIFVDKSVRLIGIRNHHIRTWNPPTLVVRLVHAYHTSLSHFSSKACAIFIVESCFQKTHPISSSCIRQTFCIADSLIDRTGVVLPLHPS